MKNIKIYLLFCLPIFFLFSCSTPDNIFQQIIKIGTPGRENLCYTPAEAYCSDDNIKNEINYLG